MAKSNPPNPNEFPFLLIGNKSDLEDLRRVSEDAAMQWCKENQVSHFFEASAKDNVNVEAAFRALSADALEAQLAQ